MAEPTDPRDAALLLDMLIAARDARSFVDGVTEERFAGSLLYQYAVMHALEIIGEAAGKVSAGVQAAHPDIPWREITGMRHRLIHGYAEVRVDVVWKVTQNDLVPLIDALTPLVGDDDPSAR